MASVSLTCDAGHPKPVVCDTLEGRGGEGRGRGLRREGTRVHPWPIQIDVWRKPSHYYKVVILQLKQINLKKSVVGRGRQ